MYERQMWPRQEAIEFFTGRGEPLKVQLIEEKTAGQPQVSVYTIKDRDTFVDFCVGPHVPATNKLKAFKLLSTSNAYWKGDAKNAPMQRIYGTAFLAQKELDEHLKRIEEAKKRDHRRVGKELGLFTFHPWAPGATFWLPKGTVLYNTLSNYMRGVLIPAGYVEVKAPIIFNKALWEMSGHWDYYQDNMFLVKSADDEQMGLKPMNCPGHFLLFGSEMRSYQRPSAALPRTDTAASQRGLGRALRTHARPPVLARRWTLLRHAGADWGGGRGAARSGPAASTSDFGLSYTAKLSTRPEKFLGEIATWDDAEAALKAALERSNQAYTLNEGDGAFYGPKIDFDITDALGRKWQCATIQLDYQMPERFDLKYTGADNAEHRPVVIHRAIFGSIERFMAILIEHFAGAFPLWFAPVQAIVLPIADRHVEYAERVRRQLADAGLRVEVDAPAGEDQFQDPRGPAAEGALTCWSIGDREAAEGAVSVRSRAKGDLGARPLDQFVTDALAEVAAKTLS